MALSKKYHREISYRALLALCLRDTKSRKHISGYYFSYLVVDKMLWQLEYQYVVQKDSSEMKQERKRFCGGFYEKELNSKKPLKLLQRPV